MRSRKMPPSVSRSSRNSLKCEPSIPGNGIHGISSEKRMPLAWSALAAAADVSAEPRVPQNRSPREIEEIVVTAQKKAESIQEVPISITALSGDFLKEAAIDDVNKLVHYTPNVYFQYNGPAGSAIFIRGFGTPFALSTLDPGVSLVL